jgi:hypothetical protein
LDNNNGSLLSITSGNDRRSDKEESKRTRKEERKAQKDGRRGSRGNGNDRGRLIHGLVSNLAEGSGNSRSLGRNGPRLISGVPSMVTNSTSAPNGKNQGLLKSIKSIGTNSDVLYLMIVNNPNSDSVSREPRSSNGARRNADEEYDWQEDPQLDHSYAGAPSGERFTPGDWREPSHGERYITGNYGRFEQQVAPYQYQQDTPNSPPPKYTGMDMRQNTRPQHWDRNDDKEYCVTGF